MMIIFYVSGNFFGKRLVLKVIVNLLWLSYEGTSENPGFCFAKLEKYKSAIISREVNTVESLNSGHHWFSKKVSAIERCPQ